MVWQCIVTMQTHINTQHINKMAGQMNATIQGVSAETQEVKALTPEENASEVTALTQ